MFTLWSFWKALLLTSSLRFAHGDLLMGILFGKFGDFIW
jgi:hypothetical protein